MSSEGFGWAPPWLPLRSGRTPDATAIEAGEIRVRYAELEARAAMAASALHELGVERGGRVAVRARGGLGFAVLVHAVQRLGAVLVPLSLRLTPPELAYQVEDCGASHFVDGMGAAETLEALPLMRLALGEDAEGRPSFERLGAAARSERDGPRGGRSPDPGAIDPEAPLALLYTSGTTGRPKAAVLSHRAFAASARGHAALLGLEPRDRWLACMPLFHVGGLSILWRSVMAGSAIVLHEAFDVARVAHALRAERITLVSLVPTMLARLLDHWDAEIEDASCEHLAPALRCALIGGASASEALLERARRRGLPIAPTYGMTEACSQVATRPPGDTGAPQRERLVPLPGTELRIEDEAGRPLGAGPVGTIALRGPTLMSGYVGAAARAAPGALDEHGWFRTGDVGFLDSEGRLCVLDRRRDLIVSGGENVYPAEVESVLLDHDRVLDAGVAAIADAEFGARPAAWIVARGAPGAAAPGDALAEALDAWCRERLARFKCPVAYRFVEALPRNAGGKLVRSRLVPTP